MGRKSLKINAILNGVKTILGIIFPLITLPYVTRILQVENLGKINFSYSIVNYFILLAGLGISTYATREGAKLSDNKNQLNDFANEIFTLNLLSTFISYILLIILINLFREFENYKNLIAIQSICILGGTIGVNWIYQIYEDYYYITIRTLFFQILSLILLFTLVKSTEDYIRYAWISVISNVGGNIFNIIYSKKYLNLRIVKKININKHLIPILIIFASNIAVIIYVNSDSTMIGLLCGDKGDYYLGLYSTSVKVYSILKTLVSALTIVALPRLCNYIYNKKIVEYRNNVNKIFYYLLLFLVPTVIGLNVVAKPIIYIIGGEYYLPATTSLHILSFSLVFSVIATFYTNAVLLPFNMEKEVLKATTISAVINLILNLFFIPKFNQNGAALTTLLSEMMVCFILCKQIKSKIEIEIRKNSIISILVGSMSIIIIYKVVNLLKISIVFQGLITITLSIIAYFIIVGLMGNKEFLDILKGIKNISLFK